MRGPTEEDLLAFLEGRMQEPERIALLDALDADPELSARLRAAAAGLDAVRAHAADAIGEAVPPRAAAPRRVASWWVAVAAAVTLLVAVPATWFAARSVHAGSAAGGVVSAPSDAIRGESPGSSAGAAYLTAAPVPEQPDPRFVLLLHGRWPDIGTVTPQEAQRRALEYWGWTRGLVERGVLVAAGDLTSAGSLLGDGDLAAIDDVDDPALPSFVIGMYALRVGSLEEALDIASEAPHLRYGGAVSVRPVGTAFVTVPGMGPWAPGN